MPWNTAEREHTLALIFMPHLLSFELLATEAKAPLPAEEAALCPEPVALKVKAGSRKVGEARRGLQEERQRRRQEAGEGSPKGRWDEGPKDSREGA